MLIDIFIDGKKTTYQIRRKGNLNFTPINRILIDSYGHIAAIMIDGDNHFYSIEEITIPPYTLSRLLSFADIVFEIDCQRREDEEQLAKMQGIASKISSCIKGGSNG